MTAAASASATRFPRGLYGVTPDWHDTDKLLAAVDLAARHGMRAVQLRRKHVDATARRVQAVALQALCRAHGITLVINDDWRLADEIGADCVHIGRDDARLAQVR
ncbi:MAG: thiamine phosphate synthase, partial [Burkholderiaceae bacterium]